MNDRLTVRGDSEFAAGMADVAMRAVSFLREACLHPTYPYDCARLPLPGFGHSSEGLGGTDSVRSLDSGEYPVLR